MTPTIEAYPVSDLRAFLAGRWRLGRTLENRLEAGPGRFDGIAVFEPDSEGLVYTETGKLTVPGYEGESEQRHFYRFPSPGRAAVLFQDGSLFHDLDLTEGTWQARQPCGEDSYRGRFRATGPDSWEQIWEIHGPRKDLRLVAHYERLPDD